MKLKWGLFCLLLLPAAVFADVDKVYDPYVDQGEVEVEARGVHQFDDEDNHKVKLGVGYGVNSFWFVEGYVIGEQKSGNDFDVADVELENKFQLTEQGQYWLDSGFLVELEKSVGNNSWEFKAGPLFQKQIKDWVITTNVFLEKKFGPDAPEHELELLGSAQLKYRYSANLEPAIEYYGDDESHAIGPVLLGKTKWGGTPVKWELGALGGLNHNTPDFNLRWLIEWEFY